MSILSLLCSPWAILPDHLLKIQAIYAAHLRGEGVDIEALEAKIGRKMDNAPQGYEVRNGSALIPLRGVIAPKMNLMSQMSGGSSLELFVRDVAAALNDPAVKSLVLMVDSPGGAVAGTPAAAAAVMAARNAKPVSTMAENTMASAAYWIASAADRVYASSPVDQVGSIGVVSTHTDVSGQQQALGLKTTEIVAGRFKRISSQYGPLSEAGQQTMQDQVDYLYSLFVGDVASQRGVTSQKVIADMADGRVFIGRQAVDAGLLDGIATLEEVIAESNDRAAIRVPLGSPYPNAVSSMSPNDLAAEWAAENPEAAAVLRAEGATTERDRTAAVRSQALPGHENLIEKLAADGKTTGAEAAMQVIAADQVRQQGIARARLDDAIDAVPQAAAPALEKAASGSRLGANGVIDAKTDAAALDAAAKAFQVANPGTDYLAAVKAVQSPNGGN
jgi:signal peptide peptidase SppA